MYSVVEKFSSRQQYAAQYSHFLRVVEAFLYSNQPVVLATDFDWLLVARGVCLFSPGDDSQGTVELAEPLVARAVVELSRSRQDNFLASRLCVCMDTHKSEPSIPGFVFEQFTAWRLMELLDQDFRPLHSIPLFSSLNIPHFEGSNNKFKLFVPDSYSHLFANDLIQWLETPLTPFCLPEKNAGPDLVFYLVDDNKTRYLCAAQMKFKQKVEKLAYAIGTTHPDNWYTKILKNAAQQKHQEEMRQKLLTAHKGATKATYPLSQKHVFRFLFAYPANIRLDSYVEGGLTHALRSRLKDANIAQDSSVIIIDEQLASAVFTQQQQAFLQLVKYYGTKAARVNARATAPEEQAAIQSTDDVDMDTDD